MLDQSLKRCLLDPTVGNIIALAVALFGILAVVRFAQRSLRHYVKDVDTHIVHGNS